MLFKKDELKILWPFYTYFFFFGLSMVIMPFLIIYFRNLGFSFFQITLLSAASGFFAFLFEIPTGAIADNISRKISVIIGFLISGISIICIPLVSSFYAIFIFWSITGIGLSFMSGAQEAWVIDNLNKKKKKDLHQEYFIKVQAIVAFGAIFAPILGSLIAKNHPLSTLWFIFGGVFIFNAVFIAIFTKEEYTPKKEPVFAAIKKTFSTGKNGFKFLIKNKNTLLLTIAGSLAIIATICQDGWQPVLTNMGLPDYNLGFVFSIMALFMMITPFLSEVFKKYDAKKIIAGTIILRTAVSLLLLFIYPPAFILASIIMIFEKGLSSMKSPLAETYFQKYVPTKIRATVTSSFSMVTSLIHTIFFPLGGLLMDGIGPKYAIAVVSIIGLLSAAYYLKVD